MRRSLVVLSILAACAAEEVPELDEVESAGTTYQGTTYQGTTYQGTTYQGTTYQGTTYQGTTYQGTTYQGATYNGAAVSGSISTKTTIEVWRSLPNGTWEQRLPDRICTYNAWGWPTGCTYVNLAYTASPLAGVRFNATFHDPATNTTRTGVLRIGSGTTDRYAVSVDTSYALHRLDGAGAGPVASCANQPSGCARNSDLYLYDVDLVDTNGVAVDFCPPGERALAIPGTWDLTGTRTVSSSTFTFACTNGTIAKCTRWGYRPFGSAYKSNGVYTPLADYHQACIRAATADYCATGHSFTKNGTLIDLFDYKPSAGQAGFIPDVRSFVPSSTAFVWESSFDKHGGTEVDYVRYLEMGTIFDQCFEMFYNHGVGAPLPGEPLRRATDTWEGPRVFVDSSTACPHSEATSGRWLHENCSACTRKIKQTFNTSCMTPDGQWDSGCVWLADAICSPSERMATHSECSTGGPLQTFDSACTVAVCSDPAYASCCSSGWTSSCTSVANSRCKGGLESTSSTGTQYGFCGVALPTWVFTF